VRRLHARGAAVLAALLVAAPAAQAQEPAPARAPACPAVTAPATIVVEATTEQVVCARRPDRRRQIASATKLMTALLVLERASLSEVVPAADYAAAPVESKIDLRPGERMTVADLLRALLLESANDAAVTLAEAVSGTEAAFVREMNLRARELGLGRTRFQDPIGLGARNRSTPRDLARLTLELREHRFFRLAVNRGSSTLESGDRVRVVPNRNELVRRVPWISGVKTGHTQRAGYVLVASGTRRGVQLVSVVLGAESEAARSEDTLAVLRHGFGRYRVARPVARGERLEAVDIRYRRGAQLPLEAGRGVRLTVLRRDAEALTRRVVGVPPDVDGPLPRGRELGRVEVVLGDEVVARVPLGAASSVPEAGLGQQVKHHFTRPLTIAALLAVMACSVLLTRLVRRDRAGRRRAPEGRAEAT
jgi:serine-type D-Ala-D-Ala carboxypeptidase (penicillin-binding protein 5/6)